MASDKNDSDDAHCSKCASEQLEALHQLNRITKEHAKSASKAYESGFKRQARIRSQKKKALYSLKDTILHEYVEKDCIDEVEVHKIDGRTYYCFYVGEYSFHSPTDKWNGSLEAAPESQTELDSFDADPDSRSETMAEREVLKQLTETFESPNHHIKSPFVMDNFNSTFVGWSYLPGSLEEGDRVPDHRLHDHRGIKDFLFEVGDTFQTSKGKCEIVDRYHAYLTPWLDSSPLTQRPAYDVLLDGEKKECIRERRIRDDWFILADSIAEPVPNVNGKLSSMVGDDIEKMDVEVEFEIGDIIELRPINDEPPMYCRLTEVHVSGFLLLGQYEPVAPSDDAPLGLSIGEIAEDVVAVHDEPPTQD